MSVHESSLTCETCTLSENKAVSVRLKQIACYFCFAWSAADGAERGRCLRT